jgi:hypothetical protein
MIQVSNKRKFIIEQAELREFEVALVDGFDEAIIGLVSFRPSDDPVVAYSIKRIIAQLMAEGCDRDDAYEYFSFNIEGAYVGSVTPVFVEDDYECVSETNKEAS